MSVSYRIVAIATLVCSAPSLPANASEGRDHVQLGVEIADSFAQVTVSLLGSWQYGEVSDFVVTVRRYGNVDDLDVRQAPSGELTPGVSLEGDVPIEFTESGYYVVQAAAVMYLERPCLISDQAGDYEQTREESTLRYVFVDGIGEPKVITARDLRDAVQPPHEVARVLEGTVARIAEYDGDAEPQMDHPRSGRTALWPAFAPDVDALGSFDNGGE